MTWIDWATVACVVYAALLSTLVAIRQQLRIRGDWDYLGYQQRLRVEVDRVDLAAPTSDPGIQAGDPVYWDPSGNTASGSGRIFPGCVTSTPAEPKTSLHDVDAAVLGVALSDSQPADPGVVKP